MVTKINCTIVHTNNNQRGLARLIGLQISHSPLSRLSKITGHSLMGTRLSLTMFYVKLTHNKTRFLYRLETTYYIHSFIEEKNILKKKKVIKKEFP